MMQDETTVPYILTIYRQMAARAAAQAQETQDHYARVSYLVASMHWLGLAKRLEELALKPHRPFAVDMRPPPSFHDRRRNHGLRQQVDHYREMAQIADEGANGAASASLRSEYAALAVAWKSLLEELTGRPMPPRNG